jgi:EAL domain-containing protein (putative c-di-GMP-specific phosphodiesterase class I)/ActR/RegA family two-component response regulator
MTRARELIVDDDPAICRVAARALGTIATCDVAGDVDEAICALGLRAYDVALVDVRLPQGSGMTVLDELRRISPQSAAVVMSGVDDLSVAREALARGALGYIVKPFRVGDLRIQVIAALAGAQRSTNSARLSARARIVTALEPLIRQEGSACMVVDVADIPLLSAVYGDAAVESICGHLQRRLTEFDPSLHLLGRLGAASLVATLPVGDVRRIARAAHDLHIALAMPIVIDGARIPVPARIGVAVASPDEDADATLSRAEAAADAARERGLPSVIYDGGLNDFSRIQFELLADASTAVHRGDLHAYYQPQIDLRTGACIGLEALVRWHHPTHGDIPPSLFVPLAERMSLMGEVGEFMLRTACRDLARLRREGTMTDGRVSVNVSAAELRCIDYPERVMRAIAEADLPPSAIGIEVTESVAVDQSDTFVRHLDALARQGVRLSIDDFGTGYSSFAGLTRLPWNEIKIDRSLTARHRDAGTEMLRSMLALGQALGIDVIAEGIETIVELDALRALGCNYGQGFLFGRPQPISLLDTSSRRTLVAHALARSSL